MIGKIMSEAAHSIIGMFSAKPLGMENNVSHSDFGSFLRSPEEQPESGFGAEAIDRLDDENLGIEENNPVAAHWDTNNVLPFINQSFGGKLFNQDLISQKVEQDSSTVDPDKSLLSPQANVILGNNSQFNMAPGLAAPDVADGRLANQKILGEQPAEVTVAKELRNQQALKIEGIQLQSQVDESSVSAELFPSSEKGLLKLQSQQGQLRNELGEHATELSPLITKGSEHKDARTELGQLALHSSPRGNSQDAPTNLKDSVVSDSEFAEPVKLESQPANKSLDKLIEQQPITNSSAQLAVRETLQKPIAFDMSSPQIAERLASEIVDLSVSGGPKKFELNPRNLGRMEITFATRGGIEVIEIQTEHRAAKDMIIQHSQLLQDILKSQGRDDLTLRVDVKENMSASTKSESGNLAQQENRDAREQPARPSQRRQMASPFDSSAENDPASDNSRYA
ncbi:flagellar hook-length control protein FliK [Parasphingorhabdus sp.]|uniref:flagellar hook-length control protein FliK n=1 Tax=Parasphingorhabdus sp. TaxID=2709688 RepID=UPI0030013474